MEIRQSQEWGNYLRSIGWVTENLPACNVRVRKIGLLGSIIKIQRPNNLPLSEIENLAKQRRALFVIVEPLNGTQTQELISSGYKLDNWPLNPTRSVIVNLDRNQEDLLKSFSKDARQSIKKASHLKLSPIVYDPSLKDFNHALGIFYDLLKQTGKEKNFWVPPLKELRDKARAFKNKCFLILTFRIYEKLQPQNDILPLSGSFLLVHDKIGYYHHAASLYPGQQVKAPYLTLWESLKTVKAQGCGRIDLEGIYDSRFPSMFKKWVGFSTFKLKWGGEIFEYPPPLIKFYNPLVKMLFRFS